tara:strand:- start:10807 stop:11175 length:369 start_codon:yes stop_codon:yes gene_type:complete
MREYEKVEDISVGEVVDAMLEGKDFYYTKYKGFEVLSRNLEEIEYVVKNNQLYTRKEKPWWEGCEGSVIMAGDDDHRSFKPAMFRRYDSLHEYPFRCNANGYGYKYARPLTTAERDAIKVRD